MNRLYKDLHLSDEVMHTAFKSDTKDEKLEKYLDRLEKVENLAGNSSTSKYGTRDGRNFRRETAGVSR